jgi:hypothetical protein
MNNVITFTIIVALLVSFVAAPISSNPSGDGKGHTDFPGKGLGKGHAKHDCDPTCPYCGGNPCIPPCDGTGGGGGF